MRRAWRWRWVPSAILLSFAIVGPRVVGSASTPSVGASAAQLLPPGTRVQEVRLEDGGYARALEIRSTRDAVSLRSIRGWREIPGVRPAGPVRSRSVWFGTDHQGRDLLARSLNGARTSLLIAAIACAIAVILGTAAGLFAGLGRGWRGRPMTWAMNGLLGLPRLLVLLMLGVTLRGSPLGIAVAIGLGSWMEVGRLVEEESRSLSYSPFVSAARAGGMGKVRLALRHIVPNLLPVLAVAAPLVATQSILLESTLSYLGVGAGVGSTSWGSIVADGQRLLPSGWWVALFPGFLLSATALVFHALAESARRGRTQTD